MLRLFKSLMVFMLVFSQFPAISIATENNEATNQNDTSEGFKTTPSIITGNQYGNYLDERGTLWYWGSRFRVQGAEASEPFPSDAKDLPSKFTGVENIKGIIKSYTMNGGIIKEDGSVWVWGSNEFGQWGTGQVSSENRTIDEMIKVEGLENIKQRS